VGRRPTPKRTRATVEAPSRKVRKIRTASISRKEGAWLSMRSTMSDHSTREWRMPKAAR
jgi:hypothetical protein